MTDKADQNTGETPENLSDLSFDEIKMRVSSPVRGKILQLLQEYDYASNLARMLDKDPSTIEYHLEILQEYDLVSIENREGEYRGAKKFYKITEDGSIVLDKMNIPERE